MTGYATPPIQVVLPAHNEAESIGAILTEFHRTTDGAGLDVSFVVCEDGSSDGTADVVRQVSAEVPLQLLTSPERKGYSKAVVDGMRATTADLVAFVDSDGQCDPNDLAILLKTLDENTDLVVGYRSPRADTTARKMMSGAFKMAYERVFPVRLRDPSCPYLLIRRNALTRVLAGNPGILRQGFWWEFNARAAGAGLRIREIPVGHRARFAGATRVYHLKKIPRIAWEHLVGLFVLRREIASLHET